MILSANRRSHRVESALLDGPISEPGAVQPAPALVDPKEVNVKNATRPAAVEARAS